MGVPTGVASTAAGAGHSHPVPWALTWSSPGDWIVTAKTKTSTRMIIGRRQGDKSIQGACPEFNTNSPIPRMNNWMAGRCARYDVTRLRRFILADDRTYALATNRTFQAIGLETIDDLQTRDETRVLEQVKQGPIEWQRWQVTFP